MLCDVAEPWKFRCPISSVASANVSLGDGADTFDSTVSSVAVTLSAGPGGKKITTGSGADTIYARNGSVDQIACGDGADTVTADASDSVDPSCERVDTGSGAQTGAPGSGDPLGGSNGGSTTGNHGGDGTDNVFETPVGLTVAIAHMPLANRNALLKLACAADALQGCHGDVVLELPTPKGEGAAKNKVVAARGQYITRQRSRHNRRLGKSSYQVDAGHKATIRIPLLRGHYRYVSRRRRTRAVLRVTERDQAGTVLDVQTRSVTINTKRGQR
jgi:hypothetical protein